MRLIKFIKTNDLIKQYIIRIILKKLILKNFNNNFLFFFINKKNINK